MLLHCARVDWRGCSEVRDVREENLIPPEPKSERPFAGVREVLSMAGPIMLNMASGTLMHTADFWMISRHSREEMAAASPAGMAVFVFMAFFFGMLSCVNTFVGQSYGAKRFRECSAYTWQALYVALVGGIALLALRFPARGIFALMGHGEAVQMHEVAYFRIRLLSIFPIVAASALGGFFQAVGKPSIPMISALVANGLNVGMNWVLIFGKLGFPEVGLRGAAIATFIASLVGLAILAAVFLGPYHARFASRRTWRLDWRRMRQLWRVGWPAGTQSFLDVLSWTIFISIIVGRLGEDVLAASNAVGQITHFAFMPTLGLSIATTALVGRYIGAKRRDLAVKRAYTAIRLGVAYMFTLGAIFMLFPRPLVAVFRDDPEIVRVGARLLMIAALFQAFDAVAIVTSGALRGAGDTRFTMVVSLLFAWFVFVPSAWFLTYRLGWGAEGAWIAVTLYVLLMAATFLGRFIRGRWKRIDIFRGAGASARPSDEWPHVGGEV